MPLHALTVVLNYNHSKKFVYLLDAQTPPKEAVLREARNKFRSKGLTLVYLRGGILLEDGAELSHNVTEVWVSKGEPYSGPPVDPRSTQAFQSEVRIIRYVTIS
jgi:release factor H-coupled RctB family protein